MRYKDLEVGMFFTRTTRNTIPTVTYTYKVVKKGTAQIIYGTDKSYHDYRHFDIPISIFEGSDRAFSTTGPHIVSVRYITLPKSYNEKETTPAV